ncbi:MAG: hypothetical protein H6Q42_3746 [Deltaproteobacteria bacterium]|nr:hypothetical protein [Deltaproteobacteria bacterium]
MRHILFLFLAILAFGGPGAAFGATVGDCVQAEIRGSDGRGLPLYPASTTSIQKKVYAEAVKGAEYAIWIRNLLPRRVGVVVAVDGRNIISGKKSWLKNQERMYILDPHESCEYRGWRTGSDRLNRFYFTDPGDSYAGAFGDSSAMGIVAIAVYPEVQRPESLPPAVDLSRDRTGSAQAPKAEKAGPAGRAMESAGTGFGREEYSPCRVIAFEPGAKAVETVLIKYEWRPTLCRLGIVPCGNPPPPPNRLWDEGFAPPPPRRG